MEPCADGAYSSKSPTTTTKNQTPPASQLGLCKELHQQPGLPSFRFAWKWPQESV